MFVARWTSSLRVIAIAMAVALLSACVNWGGDPAPGEGELRAGDEYVALGDSYTAAPGTGPVEVKDGCLRSSTNYPHQVAERLDLKLTDVSCSGATTRHVMNPQALGSISRPPQADAVVGTTDLVTISLGANDFNVFAGILFACPAVRAKDPAGAPCTALDAATGKNSVKRRGAQIEKRIVEVVRLVKQRAPKARIIIVGYPQFFPSAGPCEQLPLAAGDFALARGVNELLVQAQLEAAAALKVEYVDMFTATEGHDMCAADPWIAGFKPARPQAMFYHPYPKEQRVVADMLVKLLR
jgi:lysophospholipase L1-like esterase